MEKDDAKLHLFLLKLFKINGKIYRRNSYTVKRKYIIDLTYFEIEAAGMSRPEPGFEDFFLKSGPNAGSAGLFFLGSIFSFNQARFDFSLKSKYSGAKANI